MNKQQKKLAQKQRLKVLVRAAKAQIRLRERTERKRLDREWTPEIGRQKRLEFEEMHKPQPARIAAKRKQSGNRGDTKPPVQSKRSSSIRALQGGLCNGR
jgi:hypothetical protein